MTMADKRFPGKPLVETLKGLDAVQIANLPVGAWFERMNGDAKWVVSNYPLENDETTVCFRPDNGIALTLSNAEKVYPVRNPYRA